MGVSSTTGMHTLYTPFITSKVCMNLNQQSCHAFCDAASTKSLLRALATSPAAAKDVVCICSIFPNAIQLCWAVPLS